MDETAQQTRKQHWVPQFLIRNFGLGRRKQVWVFDKLEERVFRTTPDKIAAKRDFYNYRTKQEVVSLDPLMDKVDDAAAKSINKVVAARSLTSLYDDDRINICIFVAVQMVRTPAFVKMMAGLNKAMAAAFRARAMEPNSIQGFKELTEDESRKENWEGLPELVHKLIPHITNKSWLLYEATERRSFYLGDNPVVMHNTVNQHPLRGTRGVGVLGIEIYLPISRTLTLGFLCPSIESTFRVYGAKFAFRPPNPLNAENAEILHAFDSGRPIRLSGENTVFHNSLQVTNADQRVFCCKDDFELAREMVRNTPSVKSGPRIVWGK